MFNFLLPHRLSHCLDPVKTSTPKTFVKCVAPQLPCTPLHTDRRICLGSENVCDGKVHCDGETDEDNSFCGNSSNICINMLHTFLCFVVEKYDSYLATVKYSETCLN